LTVVTVFTYESVFESSIGQTVWTGISITTAVPTSYSFYYTRTTVLATVWTWSSTVQQSVQTYEPVVETVVVVPTQVTLVTIVEYVSTWDSSVSSFVTETVTATISAPTSASIEFTWVSINYITVTWSSTHSTFVDTTVVYQTYVATAVYNHGIDYVSYPTSAWVSHPSCKDEVLVAQPKQNFLGM